MTFYFFLKLSIFREQMNFGTAYLDGSGIYGATPESADKLREFKRGFLKVIRVMGRLDMANKRQKQHKDNNKEFSIIGTFWN